MSPQVENVPSRLQQAQSRLSRAASLDGRPGIVVLNRDLPVVEAIAGSRAGAISLIHGLEREGRVRRVRRGVYVLAESSGGVRVGVLDLVAALTPHPYLVSGGRALQFHELTDQHFRRLQVLVAAPLRPWSWRGDEVLYVRTAKRLKGRATRTSRTLARIATPERAVVDSLCHPRWGVTLGQVVEALDKMLARDPDFADALAAEVANAGNRVAARRLGFLVSQLAGAQAARPFLPLRGASKASTPLLAGGPTAGRVDSTWRLRENADLGRLLQHREIG